MPARIGNGDHWFNPAMLATIGIKIAAVAVLDIVLPIIIVIETMRITIIGNGKTSSTTENLFPK